MDYDETILRCINNKFKSVAEISRETGISYGRVSLRLKQLQKYELVSSIETYTKRKGVNPRKYKKRWKRNYI